MTDRMYTETPRSAFPFSAPVDLNSSYSDALDRGRSVIEAAVKTLNNEAFQFIGRRLEHTGQAIEQCQDCKTVDDFVALHHRWATEAVREYFDETVRLGQTMQTLMAEFTGFSKAFGAGASQERSV